jgi:hypothetical protein
LDLNSGTIFDVLNVKTISCGQRGLNAVLDLQRNFTIFEIEEDE